MTRFSWYPPRLAGSVLGILLVQACPAMGKEELRICADPNNLPFSNDKREGYENKIAAVMAKDLGYRLSYFWLKQRQGFFRQTLGAHRCDLVMGVPSGFERVLTTKPYYRSGYVIVTPTHRALSFTSYDDPRLKELKIGIHITGKDGSNSPPAHALGKHHLEKNMVGYSMWGEASKKNPQGKVVDAVSQGAIDLAIVWGPFGGYFAKPYGKSLTVELAPSDPLLADMPFAYDISMGVRKEDTALADKLNNSIQRRQGEITRILGEYRVPLIPLPAH